MLEQEVERLNEQNKQEREQSNQRLTELTDKITEQAASSNARIDQLMSMLKQRIT